MLDFLQSDWMNEWMITCAIRPNKIRFSVCVCVFPRRNRICPTVYWDNEINSCLHSTKTQNVPLNCTFLKIIIFLTARLILRVIFNVKIIIKCWWFFVCSFEKKKKNNNTEWDYFMWHEHCVKGLCLLFEYDKYRVLKSALCEIWCLFTYTQPNQCSTNKCLKTIASIQFFFSHSVITFIFNVWRFPWI